SGLLLAFSDCGVQEALDAFLLAVEDPRVNQLVDALARITIVAGGMLRKLHVDPLKRGKKPRQRIIAAVIDQVFSKRSMLDVDLGVRRQVHGIDDGQIEACLYAVVQKRRVEHAPSRQRDSE